ncbi:MAG: hypothetical protein AAGD14_08995 [Planctomycetota bacterium]
MKWFAAVSCLVLLVACGGKRVQYPIERSSKSGDGGWARTVNGKEIEMRVKNQRLRVRHGAHHFEFRGIGSFKGHYSFHDFEVKSDKRLIFYNPNGLTVRAAGNFRHWKPEELPADVLIVVDGLDMRYEGLTR